MLELAVDEFIKHWETVAAYPDHDDYSKGVNGECFYCSLVDRCGHDATPFLADRSNFIPNFQRGQISITGTEVCRCPADAKNAATPSCAA
jgi:hypothetical protein